ncbi:hypothetical protein C0Z16_30240 [Paraburkholderia rhynchosiae]|uniref:Uncharacterized protein n=2 Tax=Paraburkholderia rhynchosiae TaxID=487049 RepID=A0ABX4UWA3_9BURK|nr:hypothetical protein C0Z16_30240 [Paraburkholderia rhynchosiae]
MSQRNGVVAPASRRTQQVHGDAGEPCATRKGRTFSSVPHDAEHFNAVPLFYFLRRFKMAVTAPVSGAAATTSSVADIYQAMAEENEINKANTLAKIATMGMKAAKDIVG